MKTSSIIIFILILKLGVSAQVTDTFTDLRDGNIYKTVKIGTQVWMAENLNFVTDTGSICYNNQSLNCKLYGRLYEWEVAKSACPDGWHLPSEEEWQTLERFLGMPEDEIRKGGYRGAAANLGGKLKSKSGWPPSDSIVYEDTGFNALPAGNFGFHENKSGLLLNNALFWTSTSFNDKYAWNRDLDAYDNMIYRSNKYKKIGFSVRCVRDE